MADDLNPRLPPRSLGVSARTAGFAPQAGVPAGAGLLASGELVWRRRALAAFAGLGLCAATLGWLAWPRAQPAPVIELTKTCTEPAAPALPAAPPAPEPEPASNVMYLEDGSMIELHGAGSSVHTQEQSEQRLRLRLSGGARFEVAPDDERSFVVESGQVVVRALGTAFSVDPFGVRTLVAVERGRVQVIWRRGATLLSAGEAATFPPDEEPAFAPAAFVDPSPARAHHERARHKLKRKKARAHAGKVVAQHRPHKRRHH